MAVDAQANLYIAEREFDESGAQQTGLWVRKLDWQGNQLYAFKFSHTGLGGITANAMVVDRAGSAYIAGQGLSARNVRTGVQEDAKAFLVKLDPQGKSVLYNASLPFSSPPVMVLDADGAVILAGPKDEGTVPDLIDTRPRNALITKLAADGRSLLFEKTLGGTQIRCDEGKACPFDIPFRYHFPFYAIVPSVFPAAVVPDPSGGFWVGGQTNALDLPVTGGAMRQDCAGCWFGDGNAFFAHYDAAGTLTYLTYFGTTGAPSQAAWSAGDTVAAMAADPSGNLIVGGTATASAFSPSGSIGESSGYVYKLNPLKGQVLFAASLGATVRDLTIDPEGGLHVTGTLFSKFVNPFYDDPFLYGDILGVKGSFLEGLDSEGRRTYRLKLPPGMGGDRLLFAPNGKGFAVSYPSPYISPYRNYGLDRLVVAAMEFSADALGVSSITRPSDRSLAFAIAPGEPLILGNARGRWASPATEVLFSGAPGKIVSLTDDLIAAIAPQNLAAGQDVAVQVRSAVGESQEMKLPVLPAQPAILTGPNGMAVARNETGVVNGPYHRAGRKSVVTIYATGLGAVSNGLPVANIQTAANGVWAAPISIAAVPGTADSVFKIRVRVDMQNTGLKVQAGSSVSPEVYVYGW